MPQINPVSTELACNSLICLILIITGGRSDKNENKENVWDSLYKLNEQRKAVLEQKHKEIEEQKLQEEMNMTKPLPMFNHSSHNLAQLNRIK